LVVLGKTTTGQLPFRGNVVLRNTEFDTQEMIFEKIITSLPFTQVLVDDSGIGAQLAENLEKKTKRKALGVTFTNPNKEVWAVEVRVQMQRANVPIPIWRDFANQIHSIKRVVTAAKNYVFDAERNEKGHADKFWAWALAVWAGHKRSKGGGVFF
jgi:phage FluMu gp28-like protein